MNLPRELEISSCNPDGLISRLKTGIEKLKNFHSSLETRLSGSMNEEVKRDLLAQLEEVEKFLKGQ